MFFDAVNNQFIDDDYNTYRIEYSILEDLSNIIILDDNFQSDDLGDLEIFMQRYKCEPLTYSKYKSGTLISEELLKVPVKFPGCYLSDHDIPGNVTIYLPKQRQYLRGGFQAISFQIKDTVGSYFSAISEFYQSPIQTLEQVLSIPEDVPAGTAYKEKIRQSFQQSYSYQEPYFWFDTMGGIYDCHLYNGLDEFKIGGCETKLLLKPDDYNITNIDRDYIDRDIRQSLLLQYQEYNM